MGREPLRLCGIGRCAVIEALAEIARKLAPEVLSELVHLARLALGGASRAEILSSAERLAVLTAYKSSYRRPGK